MKKTIFLIAGFFFAQNILAQTHYDSLKTREIEEVIVIGTTNIANKEAKPLGSIDEYLQKSSKIDMIRRGSYAWEPTINSMATERTLVTIDGMRIFGACTDKMDPITSYVEVSNLSEAEIISGQQGSCHGSTIGGSIDLKRQKGSFGEKRWNFNINSGFETVNQQKIFGGGVSFKNKKFYSDADFMMRDAENYKDGNGNEVLHSQFKKINFSETLGVKIGENKLLEGSVIYDKAKDVGYPALPMDVSLAEAIITSLKFQILPNSDIFKNWETKFYYNTVTHRMDDTTRPNVPVHMDMPGWTKTFGYFSKINSVWKNHKLLLNFNGFYNKSVAEMTMYPKNPAENLMFMYTWPDVRTLFQGVFLEDSFSLNDFSSIKLTGSFGFHSNKVASEFGLNSLQIFYPEMDAQKNRFLKSLSANYIFNKNDFEIGTGIGYGDRAPSVSEGYGFYLFNSAEKYDYVGNPDLKNEKSLEANFSSGIKKEKFSVKISASYFHISDYIVGKILPNLVPMTIGGKGVKGYTALENAQIFTAAFNSEVKILENLKWKSQISYSKGQDNFKNNLPYISPISYSSSLFFEKNKFSAEATVLGNSKQRNFAVDYGENATPPYTILNANVGYRFIFNENKIYLKVGAENIFDEFYTTYSEWNKIPRAGRNFFVNINYAF